jgi:competence protein ComGC
MNNKARSFVAIMIVIAVLALLLRIGIEKVIKINISQNESDASINLKLISTALENYARDKNGLYPEKFSLLIQAQPAYLEKDYILQSPLKGYDYSCPRLEPSGYTCYAMPVKCNLSGKLVYTVTTGALLVSEDCKKKE